MLKLTNKGNIYGYPNLPVGEYKVAIKNAADDEKNGVVNITYVTDAGALHHEGYFYKKKNGEDNRVTITNLIKIAQCALNDECIDTFDEAIMHDIVGKKLLITIVPNDYYGGGATKIDHRQCEAVTIDARPSNMTSNIKITSSNLKKLLENDDDEQE